MPHAFGPSLTRRPRKNRLMSELALALATCLERDAEILKDLDWALLEHGPGSEPWNALIKELVEHEKRQAEIERQAHLLVERRLRHNAVVRMVDRIDAAWQFPSRRPR